MALLQVENIQKSFGSNHVLKGVSFTLEKGQVLAIIGSSGSGKTTLLRCLNFLETPDEGEISVGGTPLLNLGHPLTDEQIRKNRLLMQLDETVLELYVHDLPDSFRLGYTACEGICRLYELTAEN